MNQNQPQFKVDDFAYSLASMLDANQDDEELCKWLRQAQIGQQLEVGGGAAPFMIVNRLS